MIYILSVVYCTILYITCIVPPNHYIYHCQTAKGVTDEEMVNEVLHLPTPNEIIDEVENDPDFWDERNVRFQLAATFGKLQFESLKMIDENLKVTLIFLKVIMAFSKIRDSAKI